MPLQESAAQSYWVSPAEVEASAKFSLDDYAAAAKAWTGARAATKDADRQARIDLMLGLCAERLGDAPKAVQHYTAASAKLPMLADYIGYHLARSLWLDRKVTEAMALAQKIARDSIVGADAEQLVGELLRGRAASPPDWAAVVAHYKDYLTRRPKGPFRSEARFNLADALEKSKGDQAEAIKLYRSITVEDPLSSWTTKAKTRLTELKVPEAYSAAEHIARGMELFDAMRNPESEAAFDAALADKAIAPADKCTAALNRLCAR